MPLPSRGEVWLADLGIAAKSGPAWFSVYPRKRRIEYL